MTVKELFYTKEHDLDKFILLFFYQGKTEKSLWNSLEEVLSSENRLHIFSVDIDLHPELAKSFSVQDTPKLLIIFNGKEIARYKAEEITPELAAKILSDIKS